MVKEVSLSQEVPGYTPQAYFDAIYKGTNCTQRYHQEVNKAPDASLTPWNGGHRTIVYTLHVDAPAFLKRIVGVDNAKVTESQTVAFHPDGSIALCSMPVPNIPGGDKFTTQIDTRLAPSGSGGCLVTVKATCRAAGPYGLTGTIESFMAEQAKAGLQQWIAFTDKHLEELQARAPAAPAAEAAAAPAAQEEEGVEAGEEFYDAEEVPPAASAAAAAVAAIGAQEQEAHGAAPPALPAPLGALPSLGEMVPSVPLTFEETLLLYLRYMCRTGDQSCTLMESLDRRLRSLERDMSLIRTAVVLPEGEGGSSSSSGAGGATQAAAPAGRGQQQQQPARWRRQEGPPPPQAHQQPRPLAAERQAGGSLWSQPVSLRRALIGAGLLATASAAATALYFKRLQRGSS